MIEVKEQTFIDIFQAAIERATTDNKRQLVSITRKIDAFDPVAVFESAKKRMKHRIFWSDRKEDFTLVGLGKTRELIAKKDRVTDMKNKWQWVQESSIVHNPYLVPGTGLTAIGGMSFDPKRKQSALWRKFQASQFIIPKYLFTEANGSYYLTVTVDVEPNDDLESFHTIFHQLDKHSVVRREVSQAKLNKREEKNKQSWMDVVKKAIHTLQIDEAQKIVLARELQLSFDQDVEISPLLEKLMDMQPNSYVFAYDFDETCFVGATPERLVKVSQQELLSTCLAGTAPRGDTKEKDEQIRLALFQDRKNRSEHDHVVQMIKQNIQHYCTNIDIPEQPVVYTLKHLHHLYTPVKAELKDGFNILDIVDRLHPTPALGGVPKQTSLAFIRNYEPMDRGWYGAPIGWMDSQQNGEFVVAIRSGLIRGREATLFAGCGIMEDSDPKMEYEETNIKFLPMLTALEADYETY